MVLDVAKRENKKNIVRATVSSDPTLTILYKCKLLQFSKKITVTKHILLYVIFPYDFTLDTY